MRLFEIRGQLWKGDFRKSEAGVLMTILSHLQSKIADGTPVPFASIAELMHNVGYNFTFKSFMDIYHQVPSIKKMISGTPSEESIVIGKAPDADMDGEPDQRQKEKTVDRMAKSSTKAHM